MRPMTLRLPSKVGVGIAVFVAVTAVIGLGVLDLLREADEVLEALADEQRVLAAVVANTVRRAYAASPASTAHEELSDDSMAQLLLGDSSQDIPGLSLVLVVQPGRQSFMGRGGIHVASPALEAALKTNASTVELTRDEATRFGLPRRAAVAGLYRWDGPGGQWAVAAIASAARERNRQRRALWRFVIASGLSTAIVAFFGVSLARQQRREQLLREKLSAMEAQKERDVLLSRTEKLTTVAAMLSGIGHEVATPLGVIVTKGEALGATNIDDERRKLASNAVIEQAIRIQEVVQRFLSLARGNPPSMEPTKLEWLIAESKALVSHRFDHARVTLRAEVAPEASTIICDAQLLRQALVNLLLNACEASTPGAQVVLSAAIDKAMGVARLSVEDHGTGIDQETAKKVTELFYSTKRKTGGIGLAVAEEIAKSHGGRLFLKPRADGPGTLAVLELPLRERVGNQDTLPA